MVADPYTGYLFGETFTIAGNPIADHGCTPISATEEYCEEGIGGTSLASPLMAGVIAVINSKRAATGEPLVGFANPWLYGVGSQSSGAMYRDADQPDRRADRAGGAAARLRSELERDASGYRQFGAFPDHDRTVRAGSVRPADLPRHQRGVQLHLVVPAAVPPTPAGYNDVTGLGVPWVPKLIND